MAMKVGYLLGGIVFLVLACISLYRLLFWFPLTIGGMHVGQVASFFAFVICAALCLVFFRGAMVRS